MLAGGEILRHRRRAGMMNIIRWSGVVITPVISCPIGPVRKRRISPVTGFAASMALLPNCSKLPLFCWLSPMSVWIYTRLSASIQSRRGRRRCSSRQIGAGGGAARDHEEVPLEPCAGVVLGVLFPANDVAELVARARVRHVDISLDAAVVVGQREVDLARVGIDRAPVPAGPSWSLRRGPRPRAC
jgi:hypothetical protein